MMSKAKWFVVWKPSTGGIIAKSTKQIVPPKILPEVQKFCTIFTRPSFPLGVLKGGLGLGMRLNKSTVIQYNTIPLYLPEHCTTAANVNNHNLTCEEVDVHFQAQTA